jgi:hypothetical protein
MLCVVFYVGALDDPAFPLRSTDESWLEIVDTISIGQYDDNWGDRIMAPLRIAFLSGKNN